MTKSELNKMIDSMFPNKGYNCAQAVLMCSAKYFGLQNEYLEDISAPFGGGLCGTRISVCGAISGGIMFIGLKEKDNKKVAENIGKELLLFVEDKYSNRCCDKILDIDFNNEKQVAEEKGPKLETICVPLIKDICSWIVDRYDN